MSDKIPDEVKYCRQCSHEVSQAKFKMHEI